MYRLLWLTAFSPHQRFRYGFFATYYGRRFRHTTIFSTILVSGFTTARRTGINGIRTLTLLYMLPVPVPTGI